MKMKMSDSVFLLIVALVLAGTIALAILANSEFKKEREKEEAQEEMYIEMVAEELDLSEKHIRYEGRETELFSIKEGAYMYRTDLGTYLVEFDENEIKTIVKK